MELRPRVFISCGQSTQNDERDIALRIGELLDRLGYDPYVAVAEKTLRGLKENLFARLSESEYYLFVDFKREQISKDDYRGSLFSHQELAIAAFLDMPVLAFQEKGVRRLDGLIAFLQTNSSEFTDREKLLDQIATEVSSRWQTNWRNQLRITRESSQFADELHGGYPEFHKGRPVRYFHLEVVNDHHLKTAYNCYGYLEQIKDLRTGKPADVRRVENKWRGVQFPGVVIPFKSSRELDAFLVYHDAPSHLHIGVLTDSPRHLHGILGAGDYELVFAVHSQNFGHSASVFELHVGGASVDDIRFKPKSVPKQPSATH
jgi:hypothetical protein